MSIAAAIEKNLEKTSWIRKMFEEGARLKAEHGAENVFDFSLGNPNLPPPREFDDALQRVAADRSPGVHAYMPNVGYPNVRASVAAQASKELSASLTENEIIMTCGAAGALNVIFKALLNPGETVLCPAPFFVEYGYYAGNHQGELVTVPTNPDFTLDLDAFDKAIDERTKIVLINSPNNPTGQVYSAASIKDLGRLLVEKSSRYGGTIYLVSDEPYRKIVFDGVEVPSLFTAYRNSIVATSYSKDLSIPGERVGWLALHPEMDGKQTLYAAMAMANRILGYVNAPALMQRVVGEIQGARVDTTPYARNRELLCDGLADIGYEFVKPRGAFYLFARSPIADDVEFVRLLQDELVLTVPGSGFGGPGHFRVSFCVDEKTVTGAMPGFKKAFRTARG
ncbi:MAG: pyridoxal phosphate-dependent aminotransferase [Desulfatibacillaceae bacterium]